MGAESSALDASSQATVDWLVGRLEHESMEAVGAVVVKLLREGLSSEALREAATLMVEAHRKELKRSPLGYLVQIARAGRRSDSWITRAAARDRRDGWE